MSDLPTIADPQMKVSTHKCGFCAWPATGSTWTPEDEVPHAHCPIGVLNGAGTIISRCPCPCSADWVKCFRCGDRRHSSDEQIDSTNWMCVDRDACEARIETRLALNPTIKLIREIRERVAAEQAEERGTARERKYRERGEEAPPLRPKGEARPTSGSCLHCGEPTKGGKFLPGHDAAYISSTVKAIAEGITTLEAELDSWTAQGISDALKAKLSKRVVVAA